MSGFASNSEARKRHQAQAADVDESTKNAEILQLRIKWANERAQRWKERFEASQKREFALRQRVENLVTEYRSVDDSQHPGAIRGALKGLLDENNDS